jgi:CRP-like cAMP-binding protein
MANDRTAAVRCNPLTTQTLAPYERIERWPAGALLFREGERPRGVYFLHSGEVDLLFSSRAGEAKPLLVAEAGQLLGVSCVVSGRPHDCSATARTGCVTGFIDRETFLRVLDEQPALWFTVLQMISSDINSCWDCMRTLSVAAHR